MKVLIVLIYSFISIQVYAQHVTVRVPDTLVFVNIGDNPETYYELFLTNFGHDTVRLKKLEVLDARDASILFSSDVRDLTDRYSQIGTKATDSTLLMPPGSSSIVYMELPLRHQSVTEIVHHITFETTGSGDVKMETMPAQCYFRDPLILGKPLDAGIWAAIYEPSWTRGHRRVIYLRNGQASIPGRYAIDFIQVDVDGRAAKGDKNIVSNWLGYGTGVLAVADGEVVALNDSFPESTTLADHPAYPSEEATGNYICLKIDEGKFAFYEHLRPNSIRVKTGQKVKKGTIIASLGLTGQATAPHLHFHIADANSALGAEGVPFVFEEFELLGSYPDFEDFGKRLWQSRDNSLSPIRQKERPLPNAAIRFK